MYRVLVSITFDAAHRLEDYPGSCARLHGHTYTVTGEWEKDNLDRIGMAIDMVELKKQLRSAVVDMDHHYLNKIRGLPKSTAENIAKLLFERLSKNVSFGEFLHAVTVEETPGCSVRYTQSQKSPEPVIEEELIPEETATEEEHPDEDVVPSTHENELPIYEADAGQEHPDEDK